MSFKNWLSWCCNKNRGLSFRYDRIVSEWRGIRVQIMSLGGATGPDPIDNKCTSVAVFMETFCFKFRYFGVFSSSSSSYRVKQTLLALLYLMIKIVVSHILLQNSPLWNQ